MIKVGGVTSYLVKLGSATPKVILANHPTHGIREVHPVDTYVTRETSFDTPQDLGMLPLSYMTESNMIGGTVTSGYYGPRTPNVYAVQKRMLDQPFDGNEMTIEFVPTLLSQLNVPSTVILGANYYGDYAVSLAFGSDGFRVQYEESDSTIAVYTHPYSLSNGDLVKVKRILDLILVYVNGQYIFSSKNPGLMVDDHNYYPGLSTSAGTTTRSSSFASIKFTGTTRQPATPMAHFDMERIQAPAGASGDAGKFYIAQGGPVLITFNEFRWTTSTSFSQREAAVHVNGTRQIFIGGQNGGDGYKEMTIPPNSLFEIKTWCANAGANDRWVKSGYVDVYQ